MIDQRIIKDDPERISKMLEDRNTNLSIENITNTERSELLTYNQKLKTEKNILSKKIAQYKSESKDCSELIVEVNTISKQINENEKKTRDIEQKFINQIKNIPNFIHESVPIGKDAHANIEIKEWGKKREFQFEPKDHLDLSYDLDLIDIKRAAKTSGSRFYFLKSNLVRLNLALISYALDFAVKKGYVLLQPPYLINKESLEGALILSDFEDVIYNIPDQNLHLIATPEHIVAAMHKDEIFRIDELNKKYAAVSPCFRKEAGSHGKDTRGIFRVHQFEKVEIFVFAKPEDSWTIHEQMMKDVEEFYQSLELPYRIMLLSSGDMGKVPAKTYDLECWLPKQQVYKEVVSCSNCTDYQARGLGIKFRYKPHENSNFVHTLNSTLVATERILISIMENYQEKDGSINIPNILQEYMGGIKSIEK